MGIDMLKPSKPQNLLSVDLSDHKHQGGILLVVCLFGAACLAKVLTSIKLWHFLTWPYIMVVVYQAAMTSCCPVWAYNNIASGGSQSLPMSHASPSPPRIWYAYIHILVYLWRFCPDQSDSPIAIWCQPILETWCWLELTPWISLRLVLGTL